MSDASPSNIDSEEFDSRQTVPTRDAGKGRFWEVYPIGLFLAVLVTLLWAGFLVSLAITFIAALFGAP
jgi:hypothetical protein